jgi:integrase
MKRTTVKPLTQVGVTRLAAPTERPWQAYPDGTVAGLAVRVMKSGAKSFVLRYSFRGTERLYTVGDAKDWALKAARDEARRLRQQIDQGRDPLAERNAERNAETVGELIDDWRRERGPRMRPRSLVHDEGLIRLYLSPAFGSRKVADLTEREIARWHRQIGEHTVRGRKTTARANRALGLLSRLMKLAIRWKLRPDDPCLGVERYPEEGRQRYLTRAELDRLLAVLATERNRQIARIILLLLATGARLGEVLGMRWEHLDSDLTVWTKPASATKQARLHRANLNSVASQVLREIAAEQQAQAAKVVRLTRSPWVFPAQHGAASGHVVNIDNVWWRVRAQAGLGDFHIHDLRHSFASMLISAGESLSVVGSLLGHSQPSTTARYAHLVDEAQKAATDKVGALLGGNGKS